jgi:hypothetical protein
VPTGARELWRVLRPGGVAVVCEPWGGNPLARLARRWLPYPGKGHTADEEPLGLRHVRQLAEVFGNVEVEGYQVLGGLRRVVPGWRTALDRLDGGLMRLLPGLQRFGRYVVIRVTRRTDSGTV